MFLGPVVPDRVHPDDLAVDGELHRAGDDGDSIERAGPGPAGPVGRCRRSRPRRCRRPSGHGQPGGGSRARRCGLIPVPAVRGRPGPDAAATWVATSTPACRISTSPPVTTTSTCSPANVARPDSWTRPARSGPRWSTHRDTPAGRGCVVRRRAAADRPSSSAASTATTDRSAGEANRSAGGRTTAGLVRPLGVVLLHPRRPARPAARRCVANSRSCRRRTPRASSCAAAPPSRSWSASTARSAGAGSRSPRRSGRTAPAPARARTGPVNTFPLSVRICSGTPCRASAALQRRAHRPRRRPGHHRARRPRTGSGHRSR